MDAGLTAAFAAGEAAQLAILAQRSPQQAVRRWAWLGVFGAGALFYGVGRLDGVPEYWPVLMGMGLYAMAFGAPDVMPRVDCSYVFGVTVAAWCALATWLAPRARDLPALFSLALDHPLLASFLCAGTLLSALPLLLRAQLGRPAKLGLYLWFACVVCAVACLDWWHHPMGFLGDALSRWDPVVFHHDGLDAVLLAFAGGMSTGFLLAHAGFLFMIFIALNQDIMPENHEERREARRTFDRVAGLFADRQPAPSELLVIVGSNAGALALHYALGGSALFVSAAIIGCAPLLHAQLVKSPGDVQRDLRPPSGRPRKARAPGQAARPA